MKNKLRLNTAISLIYQICSVVVGLIIPRMILQKFGSEINGLTNSIAQMLSVITILDLGVGAVVQASLYKPLVDHNNDAINSIYWSAKKFFNIVACILIFYVFGLCIYYGLFKSDSYGWLYTITLICAIAISYFVQYYFGICNILLLNADQKVYVVTIVNLFGLLANAVVTVILLYLDMSIQIVKLVSSLLYLLRPAILQLYVKQHYRIVKPIHIDQNAIPQKWSGLTQHIAVVITNSVDNIVLTIFSTFSAVSIYSVYVMPLNSVRNMIEATSIGYKSFFGTLLASSEKKEFTSNFDKYEVMMHYVIMIITSSIIKTLIPFILIYTSGVNDADYNNSLFSITICFAYMMYFLRIIYTNVIAAAGKFRDTQNYCIIECILNILLSVILVNIWGLVGVAIGTFVSSGYRLLSSVWYLKRDVLYRPLSRFFRLVVADIVAITISVGISSFVCIKITNFAMWVIYAFIVFCISTVVCTFVFSAIKKDCFDPISLVRTFVERKR